MNLKKLISVSTGGLLLMGCLQTGAALFNDLQQPQPITELSEEVAQDLRFMLETEKLARDLCLALGSLYDHSAFRKIPKSEQHHLQIVQGLCDKYGVSYTIAAPGLFHDAELQTLYNNLIDRGTRSRGEAFLAAAFAEEKDIEDLRRRKVRTKNDEIKAVYENLECGSMRHLSGFALDYEELTGKAYLPQKLSKVDLNVILGR